MSGVSNQLEIALINLVVNAVHAMDGGGTLAVASTAREENVEIVVSDTGHGIPAEIMQKIFDPFFTTKEVGKGTGLGLSTVIGIVKSHGGFLTVESQPGSGSAFRVFLPAEPEAIPDAAPAKEAPRGNGELVLLVDDEACVLAIAKDVLQRHGYRVLVAADGIDGLAVFAQHADQIAIVVTDIAMPFMDGAALLRLIYQQR